MAIKTEASQRDCYFILTEVFNTPVKKFTNVVDSYKIITRSMSRKGNCWDNAVAESFFKTLKKQKFMEINLYQKNRWNEIYLNLLKFGTIEKEGIQL
jgi:ribosomal protein S25